MVAQDPHNVGHQEREPEARPKKASTRPKHSDVLRARPSRDEAPPPSWKTATWLGIILLNVVLLIFVLPYELLTSPRVSLILKIGAVIVAGGAFTAGVVWFKQFLNFLPTARWFKVLQVVVLFFLILANASLRLPVIPLYPDLDADTRLDVDNAARPHDGGAIRVSFGQHNVRVAPPTDEDGKPRDYFVGYGESLLALFRKYTKPWSPLYAVDVKTSVPAVEVTITKTDGAFEPGFRKHYEKTARKKRFEPKGEAQDVFIWNGGDTLNGTADIIYLPHGKYVFTAHKEGCTGAPIELEIKGARKGGYLVDFQSLCQ